MSRRATITIMLVVGFVVLTLLAGEAQGSEPAAGGAPFPRALDSYDDPADSGIWSTLRSRVAAEPFNLVATLIFLLAIVHTFLTSKFMAISHRREQEHEQKIERGEAHPDTVDVKAGLFHFLGEVEAVFGIWAIALMVAIVGFHDWGTAVGYLGHKVDFTEAAFVVVIMVLAATRPILRLSESVIKGIARIMGGSLAALWLATLSVGPLLGSFITEPAAMTICALVLGRNFYDLEPGRRFKYATLGLLFVNVSVGGTLTNFSAPPILMVAGPWDWGGAHMLAHFGWKAAVGILLSNGFYFLLFRSEIAKMEGRYALVSLKAIIRERHLGRREMAARFDALAATLGETTDAIKQSIRDLLDRMRHQLEESLAPGLIEQGYDKELVQKALDERLEEIELQAVRQRVPALLPKKQRAEFIDPHWDERDDPVPAWVTVVHVLFMLWTIINAHDAQLFVLGMLFFLGFAEVTRHHQNRVSLKPAMLVGFFLAGLVIHGGVQAWWIAPILGNLAELPLMLTTTLLTAFNDNASITYLSTLVPGLTESLKYVVVAGAVAGGGLTIIANAPNPAGASLLKKYFGGAISAMGVLAAALVPTIILFLMFVLIR